MGTTRSSDAGVRVALVVCVAVLATCLGLSLARTPSLGADEGPVRASGGGAGRECLTVSSAGSYTSGRTLLHNTSGSGVEITGVRLVGARGVELEAAYVVPAPGGEALGNAPRWPPAQRLVRGAPGWLSRVDAVGPDRLQPLDGGAGAQWNLVLHLAASRGEEMAYDAVQVDYRVGEQDFSTRTERGLETSPAACS